VLKLLAFSTLSLVLGGCVIPPALTGASMVVNGISYISTGKGVADHAISQIAGADCALFYAAEGSICRASGDPPSETALAQAYTGTLSDVVPAMVPAAEVAYATYSTPTLLPADAVIFGHPLRGR
jgi:hypothetical protein